MITKSKTAKCDCQWDDHFGDRPVPNTVRHAYGARFARNALQSVDVFERSGKPVMKCRPCRERHSTPGLLARLKAQT